MSTSKPLRSPVVASRKPRPGWSSLTPMVTLSASLMESKVGLPSSWTSVATSNSAESPPSSAPSSPVPPPGAAGLPLLQAVRASSAAAAIPIPASARVRRMGVSFVCCGCRSVGEELGEEVLGSAALGSQEEVLGGRLLDDLPVRHEDHPVRGLAREAHLVGHDDHRHPLLGEAD